MSTVALVAAKDAAASVGATVTALRALRGVDEVWVVDDGSEDATATVAAEAGAHVVRLERNHGKGDALAAGVAATPHATRYLLADADLGATATGLRPLLDTDARLAVGVLPSAGGRGGFGWVKSMAAAGIQYATGVQVDAPLSGQRVVAAELLRRCDLAPRFGVEVGMTIDALAAGETLREIPVTVEHHHRGRSVGGFAHRARQGVDVAGALVTRLTSARQRVAAVVVAALVAFGGLSGLSVATRAPRGAPLPAASQVVLFAYDGLRLEDLARSDRPNLRRLQRYAAVGALSVRTTDRRSLGNRRGPERPSIDDAYASVGASARVRWTGNMISSRARARGDHADSLPGALGEALRAAGKRTAVVQTASGRFDVVPPPAAAVLADGEGRVGAHIADVALAWAKRVDVALRTAPVVMVDPSWAGEPDELLGELFDVLPRGTMLVVFSPTPPTREWALTPVVVATAGIAGPVAIASPTTRRAALGGIVDIAPTVLAALGVDAPAAMTGAPLRMTTHPPDLTALQRLEVDGAVRSRFFLPAAVGYTVLGIAFYLGVIAALRTGLAGQARRVLRVAVCAMAAFPLALLVVGAVQHWFRVGGESPVWLVAVALALGAAAARWRGIGPVFVLAAATLGVILIDVAVTGPLHAATILGYSIQTTGRYYGLPNASFAVYAASLFLVAAATAGWRPRRVRAAGAAAVLAVGVAFVAAPWLGNDVGGTVTLLPLALAASWVWFGGRLTPRVLVVGAAVAAVAFGGLVAAQALGGETHLGRAAGGGSSLGTTLSRRVEANVGLLVDQWWGFLSLLLAAAAIAVLARPTRAADYLPPRSGLRVAALATLGASIVGFAVNDSGPVVNVLCLVVLAPALVLTALAGPWRVTRLAARP